MKDKFNAIESTMLIPLMIKANETRRENPRITDPKAVEIIDFLEINNPSLDKFMSHEGVIARTILFDQAVASYIQKHPNATCINLACGLEDRFSRVDNQKIVWYDVDLEQVTTIRKQFFEDTDRRKILTASMLDSQWPKLIPAKKDILIIMEGVLMYFTKVEINQCFKTIGDNYPEATIIAELMCEKVANNSDKHDTVKHTEAQFKGGINHGSEISNAFPNLRLISDTSFNVEMQKHSIRAWLFAHLPGLKNLNNRIAIFQFKA